MHLPDMRFAADRTRLIERASGRGEGVAVARYGIMGTFMVMQAIGRMLLRKIFLLLTHIGNNPVYF